MAARKTDPTEKIAEKKTNNLVEVEVIKTYYDRELKKRMTPGDKFETTQERAEILRNLGFVK